MLQGKQMMNIALTLLLLSLLIHPKVSLATTISYTNVYTDNRALNDPFGNTGYNFEVEAIVTDPLGVPANIKSGSAVGLNSGDYHALRLSQEVGINYYIDHVPYSGQTGKYQFSITNAQGVTITSISHDLNSSTPLPLPRNLQVSNYSTTPTVTFNSVSGADSYNIKLIDGNRNIIYVSNNSSTPTFQLPAGLIEPNKPYYISGRALDFDPTEGNALERRSISNIPFATQKMYGLFVGVEDSVTGKTELRGDLSAQNVADGFSHLGNFTEAKILTGDVASGGVSLSLLKSSIDDIKSKMNKGDMFVLYIASHGGQDLFGPETTLTFGDESMRIGSEDLTDDELYSYLQGMDGINKWVFLDGCDTGGFWGNNNIFDQGDLEKLHNVSLFASSAENKDSYYDGSSGLLYFGQALTKALSLNNGYLNADIGKDGFLEFGDLTNYVKNYSSISYMDGTVVYQADFGDPYIFSEDMWNPEVFASDDFQCNLFGYQPIEVTVPEPATMLLFGTGLIGIAGYGRKKLA